MELTEGALASAEGDSTSDRADRGEEEGAMEGVRFDMMAVRKWEGFCHTQQPEVVDENRFGLLLRLSLTLTRDACFRSKVSLPTDFTAQQ